MTVTINERLLPYLNKITQGHTVPLMRELPDDSVDCSISSPPYWAARIYGVDFQVYSDDPNCPGHEWVHYKQKGRDGGSNQPKRSIKGVGNFQNFDETRPAFCKHCYSWYGELGNEPHFFMFIRHVADVYDEVKRILKPTGTCWINITDSVAYSTPIWIFNNGKKELREIGEFIDEYIQKNSNNVILDNGREIIEIKDDIQVLSVNKWHRVIKAKPKYLIRHKFKGKLHRVRLSGNEILITPNHSLINVNLEKSKPLKGSKYLCLDHYVKNKEKEEEYVNIPLDNFDGYIEFKNIADFIENNRAFINNLIINKNNSRWFTDGKIGYWKRNGFLPINIFNKLHQSGLIDINKIQAYIRVKTNKKVKLPVKFPLTSSILKLMGLWIADGSYIKNVVRISTGNNSNILIFLKNICKELNIGSGLDKKGDFGINSGILQYFFVSIGFNGYSYTKRVPSWIFDLSQEQIGYFLNGYITGDGNVHKGTLSFSSVNSELRDDIADLFRFIGFSVRCTEQISKGEWNAGTTQYSGVLSVKDSYDFLNKYGLIKSFKKKYPINKAFKRIGNCRKVELVKLTEEDYDGYVYDISVPETEIFVSKSILLHNTYWGSGGTFTSKIAAHELMINWLKKYGYWEEYSRTLKYSKSGYRSKCMCMIPSRLAQELINRGWIVRNLIVWNRPNAMPESVNDRFGRKDETVIFLTKSEKYFFDLDAVRQPLAQSSIARDNRSRVPREGSKYHKNMDNPNLSNYLGVRGCNPLGKNPGNVWNISTKGYSGDHFAAFSVDLLEIPIRAGCPDYVCKRCGKPRERIIEKTRKTRDNPTKAAKKLSFIGHGTGSSTLGKAKDNIALVSKTRVISVKWKSNCNCDAGFTAGIVFDPFIGSGTTAIAAKKWLKDFIGFELLAGYVKQANERLQSKGNIQQVYGKDLRSLFRRKPK